MSRLDKAIGTCFSRWRERWPAERIAQAYGWEVKEVQKLIDTWVKDGMPQKTMDEIWADARREQEER
jgi:hypothetical protein